MGLATMIMLMYIGASPGGTGGGVKTTTFGLLISSIISVISMKEELILFNRRISARTKDKAFAICTIAVLLITLDVLILSATEKASFMEIVFETVSAFGTVGLSTWHYTCVKFYRQDCPCRYNAHRQGRPSCYRIFHPGQM